MNIVETTPKTGAELIAAECLRQVEQKGYTAAHDDDHKVSEIEQAGDYYHLTASIRERLRHLWPWHPSYFKPAPNNRQRELVKAGALFKAAAKSAARKGLREDFDRLTEKVLMVGNEIDLLANKA